MSLLKLDFLELSVVRYNILFVHVFIKYWVLIVTFFIVFQLLANIVIYVCAITVGIMSYYMADRKHRKAFLEARQSLEVKLNLEEQSQQQVRGPPVQHSGVYMCEFKGTFSFWGKCHLKVSSTELA